ncbi:putative calcium ion binding protein [Stachybotrys elegans]|uniref:Calcium ion binding protein n=1 Tax=Stachybotrys elegans TaxID=80388 RepID=A0A8K0SUI5_9HYPO|nr:putative calcium ion binding protein [Stachybotrys elegans]
MQAKALVGTVLVAWTGLGAAHGNHAQKPVVPEGASWMEKHMAEEHHMAYWDNDSFFALHDYNSDGNWQRDEIMRTYGLRDESNKNMAQTEKDRIINHLINIMDLNGDGVVSRNEWTDFVSEGKTLPDMGTGPGHHGDDEYEYEIHHWEKYHDENTKIEDLTHPEDIEHFKKHEQMEEEEERLEAMDHKSIIEENIPKKFRRA